MLGFSLLFNGVNLITAELFAIREGVNMAKDIHLTKLELEIDVEGIKLMLHNAINNSSHEFGAIINKVVALLKRGWNVSLLNVKREVDAVAHELATYGRCM